MASSESQELPQPESPTASTGPSLPRCIILLSRSPRSLCSSSRLLRTEEAPVSRAVSGRWSVLTLQTSLQNSITEFIGQRCDGAKPACGQCIMKRRTEDCEYTNVQGLTRSQMLEENIAILESRIRELENPGETAPSVRLYDPRPSRSDAPIAEGQSEPEGGPMTIPSVDRVGNLSSSGMYCVTLLLCFSYMLLGLSIGRGIVHVVSITSSRWNSRYSRS